MVYNHMNNVAVCNIFQEDIACRANKFLGIQIYLKISNRLLHSRSEICLKINGHVQEESRLFQDLPSYHLVCSRESRTSNRGGQFGFFNNRSGFNEGQVREREIFNRSGPSQFWFLPV